MKTLHEIHQHKENFELIEMIESPEHYTPECIEVIHEILNSRDINNKEKAKIIKQINEDKARKKLLNQNLSEEEIILHKSQFLDKKQIKNIYIKQLKLIMKEQKGFRFDVWSYVIGAY
ncbi:hypothetical protein [Portibacter lacus]|nr:hypothetical protein [Portibacter lacus]